MKPETLNHYGQRLEPVLRWLASHRTPTRTCTGWRTWPACRRTTSIASTAP